MINKTLAHYTVLDKLGAGGMGEVYRAEDTKLGRQVAIKVLPDTFAGDEERRARFEREARTLAALNHPNIATLYGLEEAGEKHFLAMELVEGETLDQRLAGGVLPVEDALEVCRQIAEAVEAAHERGIIHRDLKPANIKITPEGRVKVLDFGLAKALSEEADGPVLMDSPTLTAQMTQPGIILGTAPYMSPEQAKGKAVDKRTDIWAFGCILYECLTGKMAFGGDSVSEILAAILKEEPAWGKLPAETPSALQRLLKRCLEKDPRRRLRDIGDAWIELEEADSSPIPQPEMPSRTEKQKQRIYRLMPWIAASACALLAVWSLWLAKPATLNGPPYPKHFTIDLKMWPEFASSLTLSRDGRHLVYVGREDSGRSCLYHRPMDDKDIQSLPGTENAVYPFFSPDGLFVGFHAEGKLRKVPLDGGPVEDICETEEAFAPSWGTNDIIVFGKPTGLYKVASGGGSPIQLTKLGEGERRHWVPIILPDDKTVLFDVVTSQEDFTTHIGILSLETGEHRILLENGSHPRYSSTGHLIFTRSEVLMGIPFDLADSFTIKNSEAMLLIEDILVNEYGAQFYDLSDDGTLVYISGKGVPGSQSRLVQVNRRGDATPLLGNKLGYCRPRYSPDGKKLALIQVASAGGVQLWSYDLARGGFNRVDSEGRSTFPVWSPDSRYIVYVSDRSGPWNIWKMQADGRGEAEQITFSENIRQCPTSWSKDGILLYEQGSVGDRDIWALEIGQDRDPEPVIDTRFNERGAQFSPDGKWIAFTSNRSGSQDDVYVIPYKERGDMIPISTNGGREPVWSWDGDEIFYRNGDQMMAVPIQIEPDFQAGTPVLLFQGSYSYGWWDWSLNYDVSHGGQHFIMAQIDYSACELSVILNWTEELKRKVPVGR